MYVNIDGRHLHLTVSTNVTDGSESLEFRDSDPGEATSQFLAGLTWYAREASPLLLHVPGEVDYRLLAAMVRFAVDWVETNAPFITLGLVVEPRGLPGRPRQGCESRSAPGR